MEVHRIICKPTHKTVIMDMTQQVCTLQQAKRLKELGVKQESLFYWWSYWNPMEQRIDTIVALDDENDKVNPKVSAFTVAELGEMLPDGFESKKSFGTVGMRLSEGKTGSYYSCFYFLSEEFKYGLTEAQSRAELLINLIESGNINP